MSAKDKILGWFGAQTNAMAAAAQSSIMSQFKKSIDGLTEIQRAIHASQEESGDPYEKIWVAKFCVELNARKVAAIMGQLTLETKGGDQIEDDPILSLVTARPNDLDSSFSLWESLLIWFQLNGNSYIHVTGTPARPLAMNYLFSNNVTPKVGGTVDGQQVAETADSLRYEDSSGGQVRVYQREEIIQAKTFSQNSRIQGVSWLSAGMGQVGQYDQMQRYQRSIFRDGAFPVLNISTDEELTQEQYDTALRRFKERNAGPEGDKVLFTTNKLKAIPMAFSPADLEIIAAEQSTGASIATGLGVPPIIVGNLSLNSQTFSNYEQAVRQWVQSTILPTAGRMVDAINAYFFPAGERVFKINQDLIPELQPTSEQLIKASWITPNEKRIKQGIAPIGTKEMDTVYMSAGDTPIELLGMPPEDTENL